MQVKRLGKITVLRTLYLNIILNPELMNTRVFNLPIEAEIIVRKRDKMLAMGYFK